MTEIKIGALLLFLLVCSVWDLKKREIPIWLCMGGAAVGIILQLLIKDIEVYGIIGGILIGVFLLIIGKITGGQIGAGDGIIFMITGISLGFWDNFLLLLGSLIISSLFSILLVCYRKMNLKTRIPFLPFVFLAYVLELAVRLENGYV